MIEAHEGQTRWGGEPYSTHPIDVVKTLQYMGIKDEDIICAGYLHDVLEDTKYSSDMILTNFGDRVLSIVNELTFKPEISDKEYWEKCGAMSVDAKLVKLADIISNLNSKDQKSRHFINKRLKALWIIIKGLDLSREEHR